MNFFEDLKSLFGREKKETITMWGGTDSVLQDKNPGDVANMVSSGMERKDGGKVIERSAIQMHLDVVDYLKSLSRDEKATADDIFTHVGVDLDVEETVMEMLRNNKKLEVHIEAEEWIFRYKNKYEIRNKEDLVNTIGRVRFGINKKELIQENKTSYATIEADIESLIVSGGIIAVYNKEAKTDILFPRGKPFITALSGNVNVAIGSSLVETTESLQTEIRRGDAILVGESSWFRISLASTNSKNTIRTRRPNSVTSNDEISDRNIYEVAFTDKAIPLDGKFAEQVAYDGTAYRHGVSNDLRQAWIEAGHEMKLAIHGDERLLHKACVDMNLVGGSGIQVGNGGSESSQSTLNFRKRRILEKEKKMRERKQKVMAPSKHNTHLLPGNEHHDPGSFNFNQL